MNQASAAHPKAVAVIPARYASTRLPGKPLLTVAGKPLIQHVYAQVARAESLGRVVVATDDARIAACVQAFGGEALMTRPDHATGSDRIGELLPALPEPLIVNVQGDEPEIEPELIDRLVLRLQQDDSIGVVTAAAPLMDSEAIGNPNRVKVVLDAAQRALYFSRAPIPFPRSGAEHKATYWQHLGLYAYRKETLSAFLGWPRGQLEQIEELEQLRLLENGVSMGVEPIERAPAGIDTPADLAAFRARAGGA